jgi:hypothetical protein
MITVAVTCSEPERGVLVSKLKVAVLLALTAALLAAAIFGGGWKWRQPKAAGSPEHVAGWTWSNA